MVRLPLNPPDWQLIKPQLLEGDFVFNQLPNNIKLLVICADQQPQQLAIYRDILLALVITVEQVSWITPEQVDKLAMDFHCNHWWLGCKITRSLAGACLQSPSLGQLAQQPAEKRALWQQITQYQHDFYSY